MNEVDINAIHNLLVDRDNFKSLSFWDELIIEFRICTIKGWIIEAYKILPSSTAWGEATKLLDSLEKNGCISFGESCELYDFLSDYDIEIGRKGGLY